MSKTQEKTKATRSLGYNGHSKRTQSGIHKTPASDSNNKGCQKKKYHRTTQTVFLEAKIHSQLQKPSPGCNNAELVQSDSIRDRVPVTQEGQLA